MSSCSVSTPSITEAQRKFIHTLEESVALLAKRPVCHGIATTVERCFRRVRAFVRDCWWKVKVMHAAIEQSEPVDGEQSRERSEERRLDEEAWSRMDNEGGPDAREQRYPRQDIIRIGGEPSPRR